MNTAYVFLLVVIICGVYFLTLAPGQKMEFVNSTVLKEVDNPTHIIVFEWSGEWCFIKHIKPGLVTTESAVLSKNAEVAWREFIQSGRYEYIK